ncbi:diguanylate phosphodiesterase [Pseudomonas sp. CFA]|nr:diguanylate phosphodiesterase [Pseudomonas sp. CFA]
MSDHRHVSTTNLCRSGFTREYGSGSNGERWVEIGQQAWPFRG